MNDREKETQRRKKSKESLIDPKNYLSHWSELDAATIPASCDLKLNEFKLAIVTFSKQVVLLSRTEEHS